MATGFPMLNDEEVNLNVKTLRQLELGVGDIDNFIPMPLTLASVIYYTGTDPMTGRTVDTEKKISVMKKHNDWYKKLRKHH